MTIKPVIKKLIYIAILTLVAYSVVHNINNIEKIANKIISYSYYYRNTKNKNLVKLNIKGVTVFVSKKLSGEERDKINFALNEAAKTLSDNELKDLSMIVYTPVENLPEYLQRDENISRNVSNNMTEGFYIPSFKEIYIFPDIIEGDSSFEQPDVMLFVTLHEIGHHIDLTIKNNIKDVNAEKRASLMAFNKINSIGIKLDQTAVNSIINNR